MIYKLKLTSERKCDQKVSKKHNSQHKDKQLKY